MVMTGTALAVPAQAQPAQPYGTVIPSQGVNERQFPSTDSSVRGSLPQGAQTGLRCKVRAQDVDGNTLWYLLRTRSTWVSARHVANTGYVPYCKDVM
ncbi:MAG TPA: SH3 domain-containing protein [Streptomyces sp.]|nr:SH3 domain-containing protein [Streptomyces sp.]